MIRNYFLINLILLAIIGLLGFKFYKVLVSPLNIPSQEAVQQQSQADNMITSKKEESLDNTLYDAIVQKNLFHPSRSAWQVVDTSGEPFPKEPPRLFGTIIIDNEKIAILEDPSTKITRLYRVNDSLADFIITDIQKDKVILLRADTSMEVKLREIKTIALPPKQPQPVLPQTPPPRPMRRPPIQREIVPPPLPPPSGEAEETKRPDDTKAGSNGESLSESGDKGIEQ